MSKRIYVGKTEEKSLESGRDGQITKDIESPVVKNRPAIKPVVKRPPAPIKREPDKP